MSSRILREKWGFYSLTVSYRYLLNDVPAARPAEPSAIGRHIVFETTLLTAALKINGQPTLILDVESRPR
jgi:hypothetical protein